MVILASQFVRRDGGQPEPGVRLGPGAARVRDEPARVAEAQDAHRRRVVERQTTRPDGVHAEVASPDLAVKIDVMAHLQAGRRWPGDCLVGMNDVRSRLTHAYLAVCRNEAARGRLCEPRYLGIVVTPRTRLELSS